jgi:hypothetical protein
MGVETETSGKTWREIGIAWLVNQGVSTVLLFCILAGGSYLTYVMVPKHLETIQQGYERIDERHDQAIEKLAIAQEKTVDRLISVITAERERRSQNP